MPLAFSTGASSHPKKTLQKRKVNIKVLVLLHILIPGVMLSSLNTINPWLSACDLAQPAPPDLQGSCRATHLPPQKTKPQRDGEIPSCPKSCPLNHSSTDSQCLAYLDETRKNAICNFSSGSGTEWLKNFLGQIRLRHCCEYKIIESLSGTLLDRVLGGKEECYQIIDSLVDVDNLAARVSCGFSDVLSRFDCGQPYSVRFSCEDCKEAYRQWVCSSLVPFFNGTTRIRPCRSVCQAVEQKCPYFLPENRAPSLPTQYAGEPTFLCMDPNIPETGEQLKRSLYPANDVCCVKPCGVPRDGLCIEKGTKCEELAPYENATIHECNATDASVPRIPNEDCPGPSTHPSFKASAIPRTNPHPFLIFVSAFLTLQRNHDNFHIFFLALLLHYHLFQTIARFVQIFALFCLLTNVPHSSLPCRQKIKSISFHLIKLSTLIFNYFKFDSNEWQYFFILISVNLHDDNQRFREAELHSSNGHRKLKGEITRVNYRKHYIQILSNSAQRLIFLLRRRMFCGLTINKNLILRCLASKTITIHDLGSSLKDNSSAINRVKVFSMMILKMLLIKILHYRLNYKRRERCNAFNKQYIKMNNCSSYFNIRLLLFTINNPYQERMLMKTSVCFYIVQDRINMCGII